MRRLAWLIARCLLRSWPFCVLACSSAVPTSRGPQSVAAAPRVAVAGSRGLPAAVDAPTLFMDDETACAQGRGKACFRLGERAAQDKDVARQLEYYTAACNAHVGLACVHLGQSVEPDLRKRTLWLKQSLVEFESGCSAGDADSCYYLGIALERGAGIRVDLARAQQIYAIGCQLGNLYACTNEAGLHMQGKGIIKDTARAAAIYAGACERRDDRACYWLGSIHEQELSLLADEGRNKKMRADKPSVELRVKQANLPARPSPAKSGPAIAQLFQLDPKVLTNGCNNAQPLACYELGVVTQVGNANVAKDDAKAVSYYEKACSLGSGWGCLRAGDCFERGYGVPANFAKASKYYLEVCERGVGGSEGFERECATLEERIDTE
jgi:uncharacterized protein